MKKKIFITILFVFTTFLYGYSSEKIFPPEESYDCAVINAKAIWGENIQVDMGLVYTNLENEPMAYVFTVYKVLGDFPTKSEITSQVLQGYYLKRQGEILLENSKEKEDFKAVEKAFDIIHNGWKEMLDENYFGTVVVSDISGKPKPVEMYDGLPLHYVTQYDAFDLAQKQIGKSDIEFSRFLFNGLFEYYAEFKNSTKKVYVNLKFLTTSSELKNFATSIANNQPENIKSGLKKPSLTQYQTMLGGVPDYQCIGHRCAEYAAGNILGYWDHRGYSLLVEGGTKWTAGHTDPNGYGYTHLCYDELCETMNYSDGTAISMIDDGIEELCNDSNWGRNYNFQSVDRYWHTPESDYNFVQSQISANKPMVYTLQYHLWGGGARNHSVSLIGHGATYIEYYYICHDDNSTTGTTVYIFWSEFLSEGRIHTVQPGTSSSEDIIDYPTRDFDILVTTKSISASHFQDKVDSLARTIDNKIALECVCSDSVDTLGFAPCWTYRYASIDSQKCYYLHTTLDSVVFDSASYDIWVGPGLISRTWIDSDSAVVLAENQGGTEFRAQNPDFQIRASLTEGLLPPALTEWNVTYRSISDPSKKLEILINAAQSPSAVTDFDNRFNLPETPILFQNYPNPFNPETHIQFSLPENKRVTLSIYNVNGQMIRQLLNTTLAAGIHSVIWDGTDSNGVQAASGIYFCEFRSEKFHTINAMLLLK